MTGSTRLLLVLAIAAGSASAAVAQDGPKMAIVAFDVRPGGWTVPPPGVGQTVAELLLEQLVNNGSYAIVDGQWLEPEGQGARGEEAMARLLGNAREAGVDYVLLGSITRFSSERRHRTLGAAGLILPFIGGGRRERQELVVSVAARIVNVRTGQLVGAASADGASSRTNRRGGGLARRGIGALFSSGSSGSRDALLAEAIRHSVALVAVRLLNTVPALPVAVAVRPEPAALPRPATADAQQSVATTQLGVPEPFCPPDVCLD